MESGKHIPNIFRCHCWSQTQKIFHCYLTYLVLSKMPDSRFSPCTTPTLFCIIFPLTQNIPASPAFLNHRNFMSTLSSQHSSSHCPEPSFLGSLNCDLFPSFSIVLHISVISERPLLITFSHSRHLCQFLYNTALTNFSVLN